MSIYATGTYTALRPRETEPAHRQTVAHTAGPLTMQNLGHVCLEQGAAAGARFEPQSRRRTRMPEHPPRDACPCTLARTIAHAYANAIAFPRADSGGQVTLAREAPGRVAAVAAVAAVDEKVPESLAARAKQGPRCSTSAIAHALKGNCYFPLGVARGGEGYTT